MDKLEKALTIILNELKRLTRELVPLSEFRRARDYLLGQLDLSMESTENQMMWLGEHWLGYGRIIAPQEVKKRLSRVQPAEVRAVARELFRPDCFNLALVSPLKNAGNLEKLLTSWPW